jgi:Ankyrin repeats (many copies)/Ankyrin repeats (3 copies)
MNLQSRLENQKKHFFGSGITYPLSIILVAGGYNLSRQTMPLYIQIILFALICFAIHNYNKWRPDRHIYQAVITNNSQEITRLVSLHKWQANVVSIDGGVTPLHWACNSSEDEIVMLLLELGANPNAISNEKGTPVHWAVSKSNLIKLDYLIQYGANLDIQDEKGKTPLHWAVHFNSLPTVTFLVEHGVNRNISDENGKTPLELSRSKSEWEDVFNYLNSLDSTQT